VGARRRLLRWGSWFALVNAGVLALVGLRYLWYYAAVGPSVAWIYALAAFVGQMAVFAFVPFLLLLPVILLVPWPRIIVPLGVCLGSTVDKIAKDRSDAAVVVALAPVCAEKFGALPDAAAKKIAMTKVDTWKRADEFPKEFVTLPGQSYTNAALVDACYLLLNPKTAETK